MDIDHLKTWTGTERLAEDVITPRLANSLAAVLDEECDLREGDAAPVGIHWCLAPDVVPMSQLGEDGHPARGGFLPPVPLPRRMWAGGELRFTGTFRVGDIVARRSRIADVSVKQGRVGTLCFVTVEHDYSIDGQSVLRERHDIVYRELGAPAAPAPEEIPQPDLRLKINADPVLLARYSAVTSNGHRIHYDRDYCMTEELYPGLLVHGPLQSTLLLRMARQMNGGAFPARFAFRATAPLFDRQTFSVNGLNTEGHSTLWTADAEGHVTMRAEAYA